MLRYLLPLLLLISPAFAQDAGAEPSIWPTILMFGGMFVLMYFIIIRPNQKRVKEHAQLVDSLTVGDVVMLHAGIVGRIQKMGDNFIEVEIAPNVVVRTQRQSIGSRLPKESFRGELD